MGKGATGQGGRLAGAPLPKVDLEPSFYQAALDLASRGFHVFPLVPNSKLPLINDFPEVATTDPEQIKRFWVDPVLNLVQPFNVGISTTRFGNAGEALVVVDVDNKDNRNGAETLVELELNGADLPNTYTQTTPSGGSHIVFRTPRALKQGTDVLGPGLDIRSRGGYIVGAGSRINGVPYRAEIGPVTKAPEWLIKTIGEAPQAKPRAEAPKHVNQSTANIRAIEYLEGLTPVHEGSRNSTGYLVACKLKDFGVDQASCVLLMFENWKCEPMLETQELEHIVSSAYRYGREPVGVGSPEAAFTPIENKTEGKPPSDEHPFDKINREFAFVVAGGGHHILWETTGPNGKFKLEHLNEQTFHRMHAHITMSLGNNITKPATELWIKSKRRREYKGLCFRPEQETPTGYYNLWRGFSVSPWDRDVPPTPAMQSALDMFLDHTRANVCRGDEALFNWLIAYCAHLIQKPWEKPLVALVFRGGKGVGKNAFIERVGSLLGNHFLLTSNRRYLVGNFNGHLENLLLFALDEAFWSGDKQAEGTLKDLITGKNHVIEHKGKESYAVENCTRVCIIGNEDWLVPASQDERRFAVFDVGEGRKQDKSFFRAMREGMERGGYRLLLRHFLDVNIAQVDINQAPSTQALLDQKINSLEPIHSFWLECLLEGRIVNSEFGGIWPVEIDKDAMRNALRRHMKEHNRTKWIPESRVIGKALKLCCPSLDSCRKREGTDRVHTYKLPTLETARLQWDDFIGHKTKWSD